MCINYSIWFYLMGCTDSKYQDLKSSLIAYNAPASFSCVEFENRGIEFLNSITGIKWLISDEGKKWLIAPNCKNFSLSTECVSLFESEFGEQLLYSEFGKEWLKLKKCWGWVSGEKGFDWLTKNLNWLETENGKNWLCSMHSNNFVNSYIFTDWIFSKSGNIFINSIDGIKFLVSDQGFLFLLRKWDEFSDEYFSCEYISQLYIHNYNNQKFTQIKIFQDWLSTNNGKKWLFENYIWIYTQAGKEWLKTEKANELLISDYGQILLNSDMGQKWLYTKIGLEWLKSNYGIKWLSKNNNKFCNNCEMILDKNEDCECVKFYRQIKQIIKNICEKKLTNFISTKNILNPYIFSPCFLACCSFEKFIKGSIKSLFLNNSNFAKNINNFSDENNFVIALHGTNSVDNAYNICCYGWNISLRGKNGQKFGTGEYFSDSLQTSIKYATNYGAIIVSLLLNPKICNNIKSIKKENNNTWYVVNNKQNCHYSYQFAIIRHIEEIGRQLSTCGKINSNIIHNQNLYDLNNIINVKVESIKSQKNKKTKEKNSESILDQIINKGYLCYERNKKKYKFSNEDFCKIIHNLQNGNTKFTLSMKNNNSYFFDFSNKIEQKNMSTGRIRKIII